MAMNYYTSLLGGDNNPLAAWSFVGNANPRCSQLWYDDDAEESSEELRQAFVLRFVRRLGCAQALWMGRCAFDYRTG